jgi:DnaJ family protein C protein 8
VTDALFRETSPYDILDLPVGAPENDVKKQYRKKSLLIHPDKYKHERGIEVCGIFLFMIL